MTFRQLVLKNLLANSRRYVAYFVCVLFSMTVFFLFAALWFVPDFTEQTTAGMRQIILIGWIITVLFSFFLIGYAHQQFSKARAREFAVLLSYGLLHRDLRKLVIWENITIYTAALGGAFIGGGIFSRLFFLLTTTLLGLENISFSLTAGSFVLTAISFLPVLSMVAVLTLVQTRKMSVVALLKHNRTSQLHSSGKLWLGLVALVAISLTLVTLFAYTSDPANTATMDRVIVVAILLCLIALYFFIHNFSALCYFLLKGKGKRYYHNILNLADFSQRYSQNRTIVFMVCLLSVGVVLFTSLSYTLYTQTYHVVEREQSYDLLLREFAGANILDLTDYKQIITGTEAEVLRGEQLDVAYYHAPQIKNDSWRPNKWIPVSPVSQYNRIFAADHSIERGFATTVVYNRLENEGRQFFNGEILLEDDNTAFSFTQLNTSYEKVIDRYAFAQPILVLVNDDDFAQLFHSAAPVNKGSIHLYKFADWTKSGAAVTALAQEIQRSLPQLTNSYPQEVEEIESRHPNAFTIVSKYMRYDHNKQVGSFALFIMGFISLLFSAAICILIFFKVLSDHEEDKETLSKLTTVGITSPQIKHYLYGKLRRVMVSPMLAGSILAMALAQALNLGNVVEMEITNRTILNNGLLVTAIYWLFMLLYYNWLKVKYYKSLYQYG